MLNPRAFYLEISPRWSLQPLLSSELGGHYNHYYQVN